MAKKSDTDLVKDRILLVRERYKSAVAADGDNRRKFTEDMEFVYVPGSQWDAFSKTERGKERPTYEFNRTRTTIKRVINSMRSNPVAGKVRGSEDSDKDIAEIYEGQIRNIANQSNFDAIRDTAADYQVTGGFAAWRIVTEYSHDTAFDQDIFIRGLRNPLCCFCDPNAFDQTGADAKWWILTDKIPQDVFDQQYPNAKVQDFETEFDDDADWAGDDKKVRIAEHWYQVPVDKTIILLNDGRSIGEEDLPGAIAQGAIEIKRRVVRCYDIYSAIYSGDAELSPPAKWPGAYFPWVRVFGEYVIIDGKVYWNGLTRHVKDAQRVFNVAQTSIAETIARAPISQVWATAEQAKGLSKHWAEASRTNQFAQIYNADPKAPGPPVRVGGPDVPAAAMQNAQMMGDEIKANSGIFDASLGQQSNETSGRAISARAAQGELATFNYPANMANSIKRTWEILVDLVPKVYDTARTLRILGSDDIERFVKVNHPDENGNVINDLSRGKYDVVVTIGPSFSSKRQEAVDAYSEIGKSNPALMAVASDLIIKGMDLPYSSEIAERIRATLPPPIQALINKDMKQSPEVQQAMALANQAMQEVQQHGQMVQQAAQEAQTEQAAADKTKADAQIMLANIKVAEAQLAASEAKFKQMVAETQAKMAADQSGTESANERESLSSELRQALAAIQTQAAEIGHQYAQLFAQMAEQRPPPEPPTVVVANPPKQKLVRVRREANGELIGMIEEVASATLQ